MSIVYKERIEINRKENNHWYAVCYLNDRIQTAFDLSPEWTEEEVIEYMEKFLLYPKEYKQTKDNERKKKVYGGRI